MNTHPLREGLRRQWGWMDPLPLLLVLAVLFAGMRAVGTLGPAGLRWMLPLGFVLMAMLPWLLLQRGGREGIGLRRANSLKYYGQAVLAGIAMALACAVAGAMLVRFGQPHVFSSIAESYRGTMDTSAMSVLQVYLIFTAPALIFSPIGEELFFRGLLQDALQDRWGLRIATWVEALLFGVVHLCHHGLVMQAGGLQFSPVSGAVWVALMTTTALVFAGLRRRSGSIYPAILAHMAFNAAMNAVIFGFLWN